MDIDMTILRSLEREKEISFDILVEAIEQSLLTAYHKSPGAQTDARVQLDRKTGHVTVYAAELDDEGKKVGEYEDTPEGFGRIAATTSPAARACPCGPRSRGTGSGCRGRSAPPAPARRTAAAPRADRGRPSRPAGRGPAGSRRR